jgi:hypothetical protein
MATAWMQQRPYSKQGSGKMNIIIQLNPETTITRIDDLSTALRQLLRRDFPDVIVDTRLDEED